MAALLWTLLLLPAGAGGLLLLSGRRGDRLAGPAAVAVAATGVPLAAWAWSGGGEAALPWLPAGGAGLALTLSGAGASGAFSCLVAAVTLAVVVYAAGFLGAAEARARFFGFLLLFAGAMQAIVLAQDLLLLLIGWELVGACSFALIGYWHREGARVFAARRAFVATRSADLGLYLAAMAAIAGSGAADLAGLPELPEPLRAAVAGGLIVAAAGKSAQLPFSGWLRGAMLGPTPVSALLHSAAMVAAGAMLLVKVSPLLAAVAWAAPLVLWLGVATALAGATIALVETDVKRLLAASTVSQYGYLFAGIGASALAASGSYLVAHAAFKALLFLVAGLLVRQDIHDLPVPAERQRRLPRAALLAVVGVLALVPLPPAAAYLAKDALLAGVEGAALLPWLLLLLGSLLTAGYAARFYLLAFGAARPGVKAGPDDPRGGLWFACLALALACLLLVLLLLPPLEPRWSQALGLGDLPPPKLWELALSLGLALLGIGTAWALFRRDRLLAPPLGRLRGLAAAWFGLESGLDAVGRAAAAGAEGLARLDRPWPGAALPRRTPEGAGRRFLAPEDVVARSVAGLAQGLAGMDRRVTDRALAGLPVAGTHRLARASRRGDRRLLDGALRSLERALQHAAAQLSLLQSGKLHHYYALAAAGWAALVLSAALLLGN